MSCFSDPEVEGLADVARCLGPYVARGLALAREEAEEEVRSLHTQQQVRDIEREGGKGNQSNLGSRGEVLSNSFGRVC